MFCYCLKKGACCIANAIGAVVRLQLVPPNNSDLECADLRNENL